MDTYDCNKADYHYLKPKLDAANERIAELEQENERLRKEIDSFEPIDIMEYVKHGLERAAEIAETTESEPFVEPRESIVKAIRAEIEK